MSIEASMEQALQDAGFSISSGMPSEAPQQVDAPAPTQEYTDAPAPAETVAAPVEQTQASAPVQGQAPQEPAQAESGSSLTDDASSAFMGFLESLASETQSPAVQTPEPAQAPIEQADAEPAFDFDPRVKVIADFVAKTGRSPEDWFRYQALDPSEMDDHTVMRVHLASEYPSLGNDEVELLLNSKYRTDDSIYGEEDVRLGKLQLKIDAQNARKSLDELRQEYTMPIVQQSQNNVAEEIENPFDDQWFSGSKASIEGLDKISFDLPGGKEFHYGVPKDYRGQLENTNRNMSEFFDKYVDDKGNWDHDLWNMHRVVTDNLPNILQNVYRQGMSDGQRTIVEKAANIDPQMPQSPAQSQDNSIAQQVLDALGRQSTLTFKI
jgi:hypothetical protein